MRGQAGRALVIAAESLGPPEEAAAADTRLLLRAAGTLVSDNTPDARNSARELIAFVQVWLEPADDLQQPDNLHDKPAHMLLRGLVSRRAGVTMDKFASANCVPEYGQSSRHDSGQHLGISCLQAAFQAARHVDGKENSADQAMGNSPSRPPPATSAASSPNKTAPVTWEAYCRAALSGTAATAVLRVSSR